MNDMSFGSTSHSLRLMLPCFLFLALPGCGGGNESGTVIHLSYQQPATPEPNGDAFCFHHYTPENLLVTLDTGESFSLHQSGLTALGDLPKMSEGEHWLTLIDANYCASRPTCPTAVTNVSLNTILLTRSFTPADASCVALAFSISAQGAVIP